MTISTPALMRSVSFDDVVADTGSLPRTDSNPGIPLNQFQAEDLMDREGMVTVTLHLDQEQYFDHFISSTSGTGSTPEDYAHAVAFSFGQPCEGSASVVGVSGSAFIVSYRTYVREYLDC